MSDTRPDGGDATASASRPLPAHPNLEFERKRAKKLLREMRGANEQAKLADAQFAIAREYGFSSWPRLVEYYTTLARHANSAAPPAWYPVDQFEQQVAALLRQYARKVEAVCAQIATFVPRFYGKRAAEVADAEITIDDARLVIARENRLASWEALLDWLKEEAPAHEEGWSRYDSPRMKSTAVVRSGDVDALAALVAQHPELLKPTDRFGRRTGGNVMFTALHYEEETRTPEARRMVEYLESLGVSRIETLNYMLLSIMGFGFSPREKINKRKMDWFIERGADPTWVAPNGYTVLEHALTRNRSHDEVHVMLQYTTPRKALWIAAALGDVKQLRNYVNDDGTLTPAGRENRPDFHALGPSGLPTPPNATDREILAEAFYVAFINNRTESMDFLLDRGFPVDYSYWGYTAFHWALNSRNVRLIEYLINREAQADISGATPEQKDQWLFDANPSNEDVRKIYEMCGGTNYDGVLARYRASQNTPPELTAPYLKILEVARNVAASRHHESVSDEDVFIAFLREERVFPAGALGGYGINLHELRTEYAEFLLPIEAASIELPLGPDAQATVDAAIARKMTAHYRKVTSPDLFRALICKAPNPFVDKLVARGLRLAEFREQVERW